MLLWTKDTNNKTQSDNLRGEVVQAFATPPEQICID